MAHRLAKTDGEYAFASVREIPWHGLGKIVENKMTSAEAIKFAGLGYKVDKVQVYAKIDSKSTPIPDRFATYRTDTGDVFGIVGSRYEIVQNKDAFIFFDAIVGEGKAIYETAGALDNGARIFITAKLPKHIKVDKDVIDQYVFITSAHDGSGAIRCAFTPVRIVCNNTLQMALGASKRMVTIRHTKNAKEMLKQAHTLMGIVAEDGKSLQEMLTKMAHVKMTDKQIRKFVELAMHPKREQLKAGELETVVFSRQFINTVDSIIEYALSHPTQQTPETKGTLYGAYNAISGYYQNVATYTDAENAVDTIIYGQGMRRTAIAMDIANDVIKNKSILS